MTLGWVGAHPVIYLLKRGLAHITDPKRIDVVDYCKENPDIPLEQHSVGRRYRAIRRRQLERCRSGRPAQQHRLR